MIVDLAARIQWMSPKEPSYVYTKEDQDKDKEELRQKWDYAIASGCKYIVLRERKDHPGMGELRLAVTSKDEYTLQEGEIFKEIQGA